MIKSNTLKSISSAAAIAAALTFGASAFAQTPNAPVPMKNQSDNVAPQPTGATPKSAEDRAAAKEMKQSTKAAKKASRVAGTPMSTAGTNAGAAKTAETSMPVNKGDGK